MPTLNLNNGKIKSDFSKYNANRLSGLSHEIYSSLNGNAAFPVVTPTLLVLLAAIGVLDTSIIAAGTGDKASIALRNQNRLSLVALLKQLAGSVSTIANGNIALLLQTGFHLAKNSRTTKVLGEINNFKVKDGGMPAEFILSCDKVTGAFGYLYQYTADVIINEQTNWQWMANSKCKSTISNLQAGKAYWCRIVALGTNNQMSYSSPISRATQP